MTYHVEFSLEPVERETFWTYQKELTQAGTREGLLHCFEPSGRFGLGAMSYINLESRDRSLRGAGVSHLPRRLRDRQEPVGLCAAGEVSADVVVANWSLTATSPTQRTLTLRLQRSRNSHQRFVHRRRVLHRRHVAGVGDDDEFGAGNGGGD